MKLFSLLITLVASITTVVAFSNNNNHATTPRKTDTKLFASPPSLTSRGDFLKVTAATAFGAFMIPKPAVAAKKDDPIYEACVSKCMYDCTKPKGENQKTRAQCRPECKAKCSQTKGQLDSPDPSEVTQEL